MCLILFAYEHHPTHRLVLAANRDEFYGRPAEAMAYWPDAPQVLAGRDVQAGGTWFGVTRAGRVAAVTNVREPGRHRADAASRGALVADYLTGDAAPEAYLRDVMARADRYNGFNLIVGDAAALWYASNRGAAPRALAPGLYGLSNHLLDTPWPKVRRGKAALAEALSSASLEPEPLFDVLADDTCAADADLPDTGVPLAWERRLSAPFIRTEDYGTRASTVLLMARGGHVRVVERTFAAGSPAGTRAYDLMPAGTPEGP